MTDEDPKANVKREDALRLRALDEDDLNVIAACLRDALIPIREMAFMAEDRLFMASFDRFRWERLSAKNEASDLTVCQSILKIEHVEAVQYRGLDSGLIGTKLALLTIMAEKLGETGMQLTLVFSGDMALRLQVAQIALALEDFGEPRPATVMPQHELLPEKEEGR